MSTEPTSYAALVREDQRLILLQALADEPDYATHEHLLRAALAELGHRLSADGLRVQLAWLDEQGLIDLLGDRVKVARLTVRGQDVATGAAHTPGVARPRP
jgi:Fe2+ or Zn2+ uptake regulation protein